MLHTLMSPLRTPVILLMAGATIAGAAGAACATRGGITTDDDRPPVVVSSGSIEFDPDAGSWKGGGRVWKHEGRPTDGKTVRFEVEVINAACSPSGPFDATELTLFGKDGSNTEHIVIRIQGGDLTIRSAVKDIRPRPGGKKVGMDGATMMSLVVSKGPDEGTCGLNANSRITINQRAR